MSTDENVKRALAAAAVSVANSGIIHSASEQVLTVAFLEALERQDPDVFFDLAREYSIEVDNEPQVRATWKMLDKLYPGVYCCSVPETFQHIIIAGTPPTVNTALSNLTLRGQRDRLIDRGVGREND